MVKNWAYRHIFYFLLIPSVVASATDLAEHADSVIDYAKWLSVAILLILAWYAREQVKEVRNTKDSQLVLAAEIKNLTDTMQRIESSVKDLAVNQSRLTADMVILSTNYNNLQKEHDRFKEFHFKELRQVNI